MHAVTYDLNRFVKAQELVYATVLTELLAGKKRTHWMWFIFPQLRGLGSSPMAATYGIGSLLEARAYAKHELLGTRLRVCTEVVLDRRDRSLLAIFGSPDDLKFRSCMTLFEKASDNEDNVFSLALAQVCAGKRDKNTLGLLQHDQE